MIDDIGAFYPPAGGADAPQLMDDKNHHGVVAVTRRRQRREFCDPETGAVRKLLLPSNLDSGVELVEYSLPKGQRLEGAPQIGVRTDKCIVIRHGRLTVDINDVSYVLDAGDTLCFEI